VAGVAPRSGGDRPVPRRALAFTLSLLLHLALALLILAVIDRHLAPAPIEVSIVAGEAGPDSGNPAPAPGPAAAPSSGVPPPKEATRAASVPRAKVVRRPRVQSKPQEARLTQEEPSLAIRDPSPAPVARASSDASSTETARATRADAVEAGSEADAGAGGRGPFSVSGGGRSYASIWQGTQRYLAGLRWAYDNELRAHSGLHGVIVVRYEILSDGAVGDVAMVSSELQAPRLEQQVLRQIRDWRYLPEATGTVVVTWPFSFRPPR
jgi:TonB family protein